MFLLVEMVISCGWILVNKIDGKYVYCGRCVFCIVRCVLFLIWRVGSDLIKYFYDDLSI